MQQQRAARPVGTGGSVFDNFVRIRAERRFKERVGGICKGVPIGIWKDMAQKNVSILQYADPEMLKKARETKRSDPGVGYLLSLRDDQLVALIREVAPEHAEVLVAHPQFAVGVSRDVRSLVAGGK